MKCEVQNVSPRRESGYLLDFRASSWATEGAKCGSHIATQGGRIGFIVDVLP